MKIQPINSLRDEEFIKAEREALKKERFEFQKKRIADTKISRYNKINDQITALSKFYSKYEHNSKLKSSIISKKVEKNLVSPFARIGWNLLFAIGIIIRETVKVTTSVLAKLLLPIHCVIDGGRTLWDLTQANNKKDNIGQKYQTQFDIFNLASCVAIGVLLAISIANPFVIPMIFLGGMFFGMVKNIKITSAISKEINSIENSIDKLAQAISKLEPTNDLDSLQIQSMQARISRYENDIVNLKQKHFLNKRELAINTLGLISVVLLIVGIAFPPVGLAGFLLFAATSIVATIEATVFNFSLTKAISKFASNISQHFSDLLSFKTKHARQYEIIADVAVSSTAIIADTVNLPSNDDVSVVAEDSQMLRRPFDFDLDMYDPKLSEKDLAINMNIENSEQSSVNSPLMSH